MRHYILALPICLAIGTALANAPSQRILTLDDRVAAQKAIEQVYWNHRIWPKENPGPKPPLSAVLSDTAIRARVEDDLAKSTALEIYWQRPIAIDQLQAELGRMAKGSHDPATLREIFAALGDDPTLIAETLARPALADRLIRSWYAGDQRFQVDIKKAAEAALLACGSPDCMRSMGGRYVETTLKRGDSEPEGRIGKLGALQESNDSFSVTTGLAQSATEITIGSVIWPKTSFDSWWSAARTQVAPDIGLNYEIHSLPQLPASGCAVDTWSPINLSIQGRENHTAVWTGSEMIVWGGENGGYLNTGGRYNPATDTWATTSTGPGVPAARSAHIAIWTGTKMLVWGGVGPSLTYNSGGQYDPATDTWTPTSVGTDVPSPRQNHTAVWTGSEMVVWGGEFPYTNTGGRYNPASDSWRPTGLGVNVPSKRTGHSAVWTGTEMIVWGGASTSASDWLNTGGRYNPTTDSWLPTSVGSSVPAVRWQHQAVWTGSRMIVWGGTSAGHILNTGGRYDPSSDSWAPTSTASGVPTANSGHSTIWTGSEMIIWSGYNTSAGARYNPVSDTWVAMSFANAPIARFGHSAVWSGTEMIVWGGVEAGAGVLETGGRYNPSSDSWVPTSIPSASWGAPDPRIWNASVWTGTEMIVWGGYDNGGRPVSTGSRYMPSSDSWTATPLGANAPSARYNATAVWTGTEMIVWGGVDGGLRFNTGGRYDPAANSWGPTSTGASTPSARGFHTAVWSGTEMIVWGGDGGGGTGNQLTGGRYSPSTDAWTATSIGANVPTARLGHTAVWAGNRMIVWGGTTGTLNNGTLNTGGLYDPSSDTWTPTSTASNVPAVRWVHTAIWTGNKMIVWGGYNGSHATTPMNTGGVYDPASNTWTPTSTGLGVPSARGGHTAVWTGTEMIVWGGSPDLSTTTTKTGSRYNPSNDAWAPTSTPASEPRGTAGHAAAWTGQEMLIWGNVNGDFQQLNTGGRYCADSCAVPATLYRDADGDGYGNPSQTQITCGSPSGWVIQAGDCDDTRASVHPGAPETCNGLDDNCDGSIDEDTNGIDTDGDGVHNACDNCLAIANPSQVNTDGDAFGDACDNCINVPNNSQADVDADGWGDACDNCPAAANPAQADTDADRIGDVCDNCPFDYNPRQSDFDHDGSGDVCDLNDGLIYITGSDATNIRWQLESGPDSWNVYEGDLSVLRASGVYTQTPGSNLLAAKYCGLATNAVADPDAPAAGTVKFSLVTGVTGGVESSLGTHSAGAPRVNANPCP